MQKVYSLLRKNIKWRAVSLIFMAVQSNAFAAAQDSSNVSLHFTNQPIENVFIALEKQTGYTVFFSGSTLDGNTPITVKVSQVTLSNALAAVLRGKNITWTIKHKGIVLSKKPVAADAPAEPVNLVDTVPLIDVSGVVVDAKGNPIPAATVSLKGYPRGQGTDNMGRFSFTRVPGNGTLVFSSLGYDPKQVRIAGRGEIRVALDSAIRDIQGVEVVSTGYQNIPKERATGSFVLLDKEIITRTPSPRILDRILNVTSSLKFESVSYGVAGGNTTSFTIRGFSTINANMRPLIVVDGFPYEEYNTTGNTGLLANNPLNNLNPNDIESITILRDAAAASIWGTRSGNGVIVITTKTGKFNQKPKVNFQGNLSISGKPNIKKLKTISSSEMIAFEKEAFNLGYYNDYDDLYPSMGMYPSLPLAAEILLAGRRGELTPSEVDAKLNALSKNDVRNDIYKHFLQNEINQQYSVNVSGGGDKFNYYSSLGYDATESSNKGEKYKRFTFRFDNNYKVSKNLDVNSFIQYTNAKGYNNGSDYNSLLPTGGYAASPYTALTDNKGNPLPVINAITLREPYLDTVLSKGLLDWHYWPFDEHRNKNNTSDFVSTRLGGGIRYKFTDFINFEIKGLLEKGVETTTEIKNIQTFEMRNFINTFMYLDANNIPQYPFPLGGSLSTILLSKRNWNLRYQLNLNKVWDKHQINGIFGLEYNELKRGFNSDTKYGYDEEKALFTGNINYNTAYPIRPMGSGFINNPSSTNNYIDRSRSYFGNVGYTLHNKYILTVSGRIDASNFFGAKSNDRNIPLYSTGFSWNISQEKFYNMAWLPYLKVRGTFGYNGNMNNKATALPTGRYKTGSAYNLHFLPSLQLLSPANPGLTWEKVRVINTGIDFESKKNRITGSLDFYTKEGINLIGAFISESSIGFNSYTSNYANLKGKGIDLILNTKNIDNTSFQWQSNISLSYNTDKVTKYHVLENVARSLSNNLDNKIVVVGKPLIRVNSYQFAGLDPQTGDPMGFVNGKPVGYEEYLNSATVDDLKYSGPATPQIFGNILNRFSYKVLSLSFNITYKFKYYFRRQSIMYSTLVAGWGGHSDYGLRWKKPGDELITNIPSQPIALNDQRDEFFAKSDALVHKGDHIRLQDIRLDYDLSSLISKNRPDQRTLQIYVYTSNLGILWRANKENLDPENHHPAAVPPSKNISFGINLGL